MSRHPAVAALRALEAGKYNGEYYRRHYWREDLPGVSGNRGLSYEDPDHERRFQYLFETIVVPLRPNSYLDAGAGQGHLLRRSLEAGIDAFGIDVSPIARSSFGKRFSGGDGDRFLTAAITKIPFPDDRFDLVLCLDVLEHVIVFDVFDAISELTRLTHKTLVCSINLDNPYEFHPSILSKETWIALFESTDRVRYDENASCEFNETIKARFSEYDLFVFRAI
jgi:2-polyprenyl-3-methyl-5-hydroxy-6-metoxy-1,4-benzoquinol methylase